MFNFKLKKLLDSCQDKGNNLKSASERERARIFDQFNIGIAVSLCAVKTIEINDLLERRKKKKDFLNEIEIEIK